MICFNDSSIRCTWIQPPRTIKILIESLWITDKAAFSGIVDHFERQIRAYENSFKLAIQACGYKTAAANRHYRLRRRLFMS
jgi:hypothetical protein